MAEPKLRFRFREPEVDTNLPIVDGTVKVEGFEFELAQGPGEFDAWDCGFGELVSSKALGAPYISIPAFPNRKFRLSYIYVNSAAGSERPRDLAGKRVGIMAWNNTAGIWARGALQNYYEVDLTRIRWLTRNPDATPAAPGIRIERLPDGGNVDSMLVSGEIDAVIDPNVLPSITQRDPRVRRLFREYKTEEQTYFKQTGIFPISHVITLKQEFVDRHPEAPVALLKAYREARDVAFDHIQGADPQILTVSWVSAAMDEQRAVMGDNYWPYNVVDNRRPLEAITEFAYQQGVTRQQLDYRSFFHSEAAALPGA